MCMCVCVWLQIVFARHNFEWEKKENVRKYTFKFFWATNSFQRAVNNVELRVPSLRMPPSRVPLAVLSTFLSPQLPRAQRHLGDALTKRVPNECGKWEYQFDELCYSISAINFPVAPLSKMESRMIEPLFPYLILFLGSCLRAYCMFVWMRVWSSEGERFLGESHFVCERKKKLCSRLFTAQDWFSPYLH